MCATGESATQLGTLGIRIAMEESTSGGVVATDSHAGSKSDAVAELEDHSQLSSVRNAEQQEVDPIKDVSAVLGASEMVLPHSTSENGGAGVSSAATFKSEQRLSAEHQQTVSSKVPADDDALRDSPQEVGMHSHWSDDSRTVSKDGEAVPQQQAHTSAALPPQALSADKASAVQVGGSFAREVEAAGVASRAADGLESALPDAAAAAPDPNAHFSQAPYAIRAVVEPCVRASMRQQSSTQDITGASSASAEDAECPQPCLQVPRPTQIPAPMVRRPADGTHITQHHVEAARSMQDGAAAHAQSAAAAQPLQTAKQATVHAALDSGPAEAHSPDERLRFQAAGKAAGMSGSSASAHDASSAVPLAPVASPAHANVSNTAQTAAQQVPGHATGLHTVPNDLQQSRLMAQRARELAADADARLHAAREAAAADAGVTS